MSKRRRRAYRTIAAAAGWLPFFLGAALWAPRIEAQTTGNPAPMAGDCTVNAAAAVTCTRTGGTAFAPSATVDATNAGNITSGVLSQARLPAAVSLVPQSNTQLASHVCTLIGDSLSAGMQDGSGVNLATALQAMGGQCSQVINLGVSGQTSTQIAVRLGAVSTTATVAGGSIPACATAGACASVGVSFPAGYEPVTTGSSYSNSGQPAVNATISGVPGAITWNGSAAVFTRSGSGAAVSSAANTAMTVNAANALGGMNILWVGRNNYQSQAQVLSDVAALVAAMPSPKRFLVLSVLNGDLSPEWTVNGTAGTGATQLANLNAALASAYPANFLDVLALLKSQGNSSLPQDAIDLAHGVVPNSMRAFRAGGALASAIADTTSCSFSLPTGTVQAGFTLQVDQERIYVSAVDGTSTSVTGCTRGYAGTTAATHSSGTPTMYWDGIHVGGPQADTLIAQAEAAWIAANDPGPGASTGVLAQNLPARMSMPPAIGQAKPAPVYANYMTAGVSGAGTPYFVLNATTPTQLIYGGSGYTGVPSVTFSNGATGTAVVTGGTVSSITMTSYGVPSTTYPTVVFSGGSPTVAAVALANAAPAAMTAAGNLALLNGAGATLYGGQACFRTTSGTGTACLSASGNGSYVQVNGSGILAQTTNTGLVGHPAFRFSGAYFGTTGVDANGPLTLHDSSGNGSFTLGVNTGTSYALVGGSGLLAASDNTQSLGAGSYRFKAGYFGTTGVVSSGPVVGQYLQETLSTPSSSSATCTAGQILADANYLYVCTAANTYKRVALGTF